MSDEPQIKPAKSDEESEGSVLDLDSSVKNTSEIESNVEESPEKPGRRRRRRATDASDELILSETDSEDDLNVVENVSRVETLNKVVESSEYESAEEEKPPAKEVVISEPEVPANLEESVYEVVDEEGGEEAIAENEEVEEEEFVTNEADDVSTDGEVDEEEENDVEEERQQGDGEECSPNEDDEKDELDFDEDKRNPQYIPKKGVFYEHDDRNSEEISIEKPVEPPIRDRNKKKLWQDEGRWGHDRYHEDEQVPKSKNELIDAYGYDIRNEDGPPRARRRRRYGRGPLKYDRNWEDEEAYDRDRPPRGGPRGRRGEGRGGSRFRGQGRRDYDSRDNRENDNVDHDDRGQNNRSREDFNHNNNTPTLTTNDFPALPKTTTRPASPPPTNTDQSKDTKSTMPTLTFENSNYNNQRSPPERENLPPRLSKTSQVYGSADKNQAYGSSDRGQRRPIVSRGRGMRGRGKSTVSPRFMEKVHGLSNDMEQLSMENSGDGEEDGHDRSVVPQPSVNKSDIQNITPKGAGDASGRPKRYSSMRQRSLPESNAYQPQNQQQQNQSAHQQYYETSYQPPIYAPNVETGVPTPSTQSQAVNSTPIMNQQAYQTYTPPPYTDNYGLRMQVTTPPPRLFPQVSVPAAQPILAPPPIISPAPNMMSFAPPPPPTSYHQFAAYQQYATPPPPPPPQAPPSEVYQTGITYYYPQNQPPAPVPRHTVQKRPKVAIPILPPPERDGKRREGPSSLNGRNYVEHASNAENLEVLRTDPSQLHSTVGVES